MIYPLYNPKHEIRKAQRLLKGWRQHVNSRKVGRFKRFPRLIIPTQSDLIKDTKSVESLSLEEERLRIKHGIEINISEHNHFKVGTIIELMTKYAFSNHDINTIKTIFCQGAALTGDACYLSSWPIKQWCPKKQRRRDAKAPNNTASSPPIFSDDREMQSFLAEQTAKEHDMNWLGPRIPWNDRPRDIPHFARRFPLRQPAKIRLIDDARKQNTLMKVRHRLVLSSITDLARMNLAASKACELHFTKIPRHKSAINMKYQLTRRAHRTRPAQSDKVQATGLWSFDLADAYKQFYVRPSDLIHNWISYSDTEGNGFCTQSRTLVFGHISSVYSFNVISITLQRLINKIFQADICRSYFDDYFGIAAAGHEESTVKLAIRIARCFGFRVKDSKTEFTSGSGDSIKLLGHRVRVNEQADLESEVIPQKLEKATKNVQALLVNLDQGAGFAPTLSEFQSIIGKFESFLTISVQERKAVARAMLRPARDACYALLYGTFPVEFDIPLGMSTSEIINSFFIPRAIRALAAAAGYVNKHPKTVFHPVFDKKIDEVFVYTDAAVEPNKIDTTKIDISLGGIVITAKGAHYWTLFETVSKEDIPAKSPICFLETMAVIITATKFPDLLTNRIVYFFIDNSAAFYGLMKGATKCLRSHQLIVQFYNLILEINANTWFEWLPSELNPGDAATRILMSPVDYPQDFLIILGSLGVKEMNWIKTPIRALIPPIIECPTNWAQSPLFPKGEDDVKVDLSQLLSPASTLEVQQLLGVQT